ncbi:hypothetical protein ACMZ29_04130 [Brevibacterium casei]|uniref:hypothetical protein n=1 Tax=Brevibacterium casei TaxID=33889 RepID=UPI0039EF6B93
MIRTFQIAYGIKVLKDPEEMTRSQLIEALYSVAEYGSAKLIESRSLHNVIVEALRENHPVEEPT